MISPPVYFLHRPIFAGETARRLHPPLTYSCQRPGFLRHSELLGAIFTVRLGFRSRQARAAIPASRSCCATAGSRRCGNRGAERSERRKRPSQGKKETKKGLDGGGDFRRRREHLCRRRSTSVKQFFPRACVAVRFRRAGCGLLSRPACAPAPTNR